MRIAFVLPGLARTPIGGFKVVYEYANLLVDRGHQVTVVHPWHCHRPSSLREQIDSWLWVARRRRDPRKTVAWQPIDRRVELSVVTCPSESELPQDADALIATAWQTAGWVADATRGADRGFYLIQHFEPWDDEGEVRATWKLPLHKIVISRWLEELAIEMGEGGRTSWVPNGLDFDCFGVDVPPEDRAPRVGALLNPYKCPEDVIASLSLARERVPSLTAATYGTAVRRDDLPEWVDYVRLPSPGELRRLYNSCSIFLQASRTEGWGLPATEAMACGCALVTYENGGSREYATDGETATVVFEHGAERLADAIVALVDSPARRLDLARHGRERAETFTWQRSAEAFERVLSGAAGGREQGG
ncbi:MAG: glycosyltransferase family 4 protein [Mycobacteriales bacterium]